MAERRMFAKTIIDSDAFLDMPLSTQALYFHLSMRADDEGFINKPKMIMRMIGANQNELEILLAKRYLLSFDSGVVVVKHWKIHNYIQKDRFKPTLYKEERETISVKGNNSYTEKELNELYPECIQNGDTGKVREVKSKVNKDTAEAEEAFLKFYSNYPKKRGKPQAEKAFKKAYKSLPSLPELLSILDRWKKTEDWQKQGGQFIPYPASWLNAEGWNDDIPEPWTDPDVKASNAAAATTDVFWKICPDCGYQVKSIGARDQCPACGEYGISFKQGRGARYPKEIA